AADCLETPQPPQRRPRLAVQTDALHSTVLPVFHPDERETRSVTAITLPAKPVAPSDCAVAETAASNVPAAPGLHSRSVPVWNRLRADASSSCEAWFAKPPIRAPARNQTAADHRVLSTNWQ